MAFHNNIKQHILQLLTEAIVSCQQNNSLPENLEFNLQLERTRDASHGDFACNVALTLAKQAHTKPRDIAVSIVEAIAASDMIAKVDIAGPGFINFFVKQSATLGVISEILKASGSYGRSNYGEGKRVQVEFVSANPTGPLHVGHGRGAAYGAAVADLLAAVGYEVHREYYVNDAGRQMDILAVSVWLRYLELCGEEFPFPVNAYKGDYVWDVAAKLHRENAEKFLQPWKTIAANLPADETDGGDKEQYIDALIGMARSLLGETHYRSVFDTGLNYILADIKDDLSFFGIEYESWFSERSLTENGDVDEAVQRLTDKGFTYKQGGAIWFKSTEFDDEKDRVLVRDNGQSTYFASDVAYHMNKLERGFDRVIDVWGADHHGYVPRVKAALQALGDDVNKLDVLLVQFAILYRGGEKAQMSTRSGEFVTLRQLRKDVGSDAARFFYVMRKCEQHLDFDLDLAKSQSSENPMYYIQYAHARVCSVMNQLQEKGFKYDQQLGLDNLSLLNESHEESLISRISYYPELLQQAAIQHEPHQLAHYLRDLANELHTYYNAHKFIVNEAEIRNARLTLIISVRQVIANGLKLLGVSAPESM